MIFTCKTTNLNKAIQTVQRAISSKPSTPIFSGIHLIADNNILIGFFCIEIKVLCVFCHLLRSALSGTEIFYQN